MIKCRGCQKRAAAIKGVVDQVKSVMFSQDNKPVTNVSREETQNDLSYRQGNPPGKDENLKNT
jgi:hypothetical protein